MVCRRTNSPVAAVAVCGRYCASLPELARGSSSCRVSSLSQAYYAHSDISHGGIRLSLTARKKGNGTEGKRVLLDANAIPRILTYVPLLYEFREAGYDCYLRVPQYVDGSDLRSLGIDGSFVISCTHDKVESISGVDLYLTAEANSEALPPRGAASVGIVHSLPDDDELRPNHNFLRAIPPIIRRFDYVITPYTLDQASFDLSGAHEYVDGVYPDSLLTGRQPWIAIVPGGYPKVGYLWNRWSVGEARRDCIVFAPTNFVHPASMGFDKALRVLESLARTLTDYTIVFRPYPPNWRNAKYKRAIEEFLSNSSLNARVQLDTTWTGLEYLDRAATVVSDASSAAVTFALASEKPVVLCGSGAATQDEPYVTQNAIGYKAAGESVAVDAVMCCLRGNRAWWRKHIASLRNQVLVNDIFASRYIVSQAERFIRRERLEGWHVINRRSFEVCYPDRSIDRHLEDLREKWDGGHVRKQAAYEEILSSVREK